MSKEKAGISELPDQKSGVPKIIIYKGSDTECCTLGCQKALLASILKGWSTCGVDAR